MGPMCDVTPVMEVRLTINHLGMYVGAIFGCQVSFALMLSVYKLENLLH